MSQITLDLVSLDGKPLVGLSRCFEGSGGTIGRDEGNTLALPDTHRRVSRLHAAVSFPGGVATITNSSAALPITVGGLQLECGQAIALVPGIELEIGPYALVVRKSAFVPGATPVSLPAHPPVQVPVLLPEPVAQVPPYSAAQPASPPPPMPMVASPYDSLAMPAAGAADPFADLLGMGPASFPPPPASYTPTHPPAYSSPASPAPSANLSFDDPLAGLLGSAGPAALLRSTGLRADPLTALDLGPGPSVGQSLVAAHSPPPYTPPAYAPPTSVIPDDFNPFDMPSASARNSADPLLSMLDGADAAGAHTLTQGEQSIDALFTASSGGRADLLGGGSSSGAFGGSYTAAPFGAAASLLPEGDNSDPLAMFGSPGPGHDSFARPVRDDLAEVGGAYQPPRALQPALPDPAFSFAPAPAAAQQHAHQQVFAPPAPPAVAMPSYPADALTQAFLSGAKLSPSALPNGLTPEIMTIVGSLLHSATGGAIELLGIRANIKREVQANVTIISSQANNPLKFLPDADSALQQFLGKKIPGFMRPDEAMADAFNDLRAHELGVMAGMRAALGEVLGKFDPSILEGRLIGGSLLERALPAMRKTKLWDLYLERYALIRREAEDDFQSIFGEAFMKAYERETARMKAQGRSQGAGRGAS